MSSILLRKVLIRDEECLWPHLPTEVKSAIKNGYLSLLQTPLTKTLRRKICDTVAEITSQEGGPTVRVLNGDQLTRVSSGEGAAQLLPQLVEWLGGDNQELRVSALMITSQLCRDFSDVQPSRPTLIARVFHFLLCIFLQDVTPYVLPLVQGTLHNMQITQPELAYIRLAALDLFSTVLPMLKKEVRPVWQAGLPLATQVIPHSLLSCIPSHSSFYLK